MACPTAPPDSTTSASTVGLPRESSTSRPMTASISNIVAPSSRLLISRRAARTRSRNWRLDVAFRVEPQLRLGARCPQQHPAAARELEQQTVAVVLADHRVPGELGERLLIRARQRRQRPLVERNLHPARHQLAVATRTGRRASSAIVHPRPRPSPPPAAPRGCRRAPAGGRPGRGRRTPRSRPRAGPTAGAARSGRSRPASRRTSQPGGGGDPVDQPGGGDRAPDAAAEAAAAERGSRSPARWRGWAAPGGTPRR